MLYYVYVKKMVVFEIVEEMGTVFKLHAANMCYVKTNYSFQRYIYDKDKATINRVSVSMKLLIDLRLVTQPSII
jgi:hypothetical protein